MKIKLLILSLLITGFSHSNDMIENQYEIIFNNEDTNQTVNNHSKNDIHGGNNVLKNIEEKTLINKNNMFEDCIKRSNNLINVLDKLKSLPTEDRVIVLYRSVYWSTLSEEDKTNTLVILASIDSISEEQYVIVKGKIAGSYQEECSNLTKH